MFLCLLFRIAGDIGIELRYQRRSTNRRRNITYWSCFYPSCNPDFSSFLLGGLHLPLQDLLQSPLLRLTTTAYTVALGLYFLSTGQVHKAAATTANHFLLRRLITPQWKLLLDNFRFIPPVVELRNKDFFFLFQTRHEFWNTTPLQEILRSSAEIQRMWASDGMVPRRKEHSSKTAQGFASRWATPFSMKMTTQQQWNNKILPGPRWSICSESTKQPPPVLDIQCHRMDETKGFGRTGKSRLTTATGSTSCYSLLLFWIVIRNRICD